MAKARKGIKEKARTLAPEPPFDLRENREGTPNDNVYQQLRVRNVSRKLPGEKRLIRTRRFLNTIPRTICLSRDEWRGRDKCGKSQ